MTARLSAIQVCDAFNSLFSLQDPGVALIEDELYGRTGIKAMRIVAHCVFEFNGQKLRPNRRAHRDAAKFTAASSRLRNVQAELEKLRNQNTVTWVLAYHINGTEAWNLACSANMDIKEAGAQLFTRVSYEVAYLGPNAT